MSEIEIQESSLPLPQSSSSFSISFPSSPPPVPLEESLNTLCDDEVSDNEDNSSVSSNSSDSNSCQSSLPIDRQSRKSVALKAAKAEVQWKLFADLDTQDEAEMLQLAVFMQTLLDIIPYKEKMMKKFNEEKMAQLGQNTIESGEASTEKEEEEEEIKSDNTLHNVFSNYHYDSDVESESPEETFIPLNNVNIDIIRDNKICSNSNQNENNDDGFDISKKRFDIDLVSEVINHYVNGRKMNQKSLIKVLRKIYRIYRDLPNTTHTNITDTGKITVVGDLHGQLVDLVHILNEQGMPHADNKFVFNGDFVDRGEYGLEIVVILFLLVLAEGPQVVCLNRGNHEDPAVCRVYGFEKEVKSKYEELVFEMFAEIFRYIPLFTIVNDKAFIVHGGLFHNHSVTTATLLSIPRYDYFVKPHIPYPDNLRGLNPEEKYTEYLKQLQRDALWSDPCPYNGCYLNSRGAGISFGPDWTQIFMDTNKFDMLIRSHECVYNGFSLPYHSPHYLNQIISRSSLTVSDVNKTEPSDSLEHSEMDLNLSESGDSICLQKFNDTNAPFLCTLFSASNYTGGDNDGAILQLMTHPFKDSCKVNENSTLHFKVKRYRASKSNSSLENTNRLSLMELLLRKKSALLSSFEAMDVDNTGLITKNNWADAMLKVTMIRINWLAIIKTIAPAESLDTNNKVDYRKFLAYYSLENKIALLNGNSNSQSINSNIKSERSLLMDEMYGQRKQLESVFYFFDINNDGVISLEELKYGCDYLNTILPEDYQLTNIERMLEVMDFDGSGTIDLNEFFETFRILDAKDGNVDGVISLAKKN